MKRIIFGLALVLVLCAGCGQADRGVVQLSLRDGGGETFCVTVYENGKARACGAFSPTARLLEVDCAGISARVEEGEIVNRVQYVSVQDAAGQAVESETLTALVETAAATIDHEFFTLTVAEEAGQYFALVALNTNWTSPCVLYAYDPAADTLTELHRWDDVILTGAALPQD